MSRIPFSLLAMLVAVFLVAATAVAAQLEEEDLGEREMATPEPPPPTPLDSAVIALFEQAESLYNSADQPSSLPLLGQVIDRLGGIVGSGNPPPEARELLARSLSYRAQVQLNLGQSDSVAADLGRLLTVLPSFELDAELVSAKLVDQLEELRQSMVGYLSFPLLEPPDLELRVDGRRVDALAGPVAVLAGTRRITARRAGYAPRVLELEVEAATTNSLELELERESAVLRLYTRPSGATVLIDDIARGTTEGTAPEGFLPPGAAAVYLREEFSDELVIDRLALGRHQLEIRMPGYRSYRVPITIEDSIDYQIPPVVLDPERGTVLLRGLPADAGLRVDGEVRTVSDRRGEEGRLELPPGEYRLLIDRGPARMFSRRITLADRQTVEVDVRLRPGLALLGILGGDREAARRLKSRLESTLAGSGKWTVLDHGERAAELFTRRGLDVSRLRSATASSMAMESGSPPAAVDWRALQGELDDAIPGLVYVLGVLSNDLLATHADLLIWPAAPGPARPDRIRLALDDDASFTRLEAAFNRSVRLHRPWLGALVLDSDAAAHPVVAAVTADGPAARAGIRAGNEIRSVAGVPVTSAAALDDRVAAAEVGEEIELSVLNAPGEAAREVRVALGQSPLILARREEGQLWSVLFADLMLLAERADEQDAWIVQLDRAKAFLDNRDWVAAARELRAAKAPADSPGVGQGTIDYWLGIALANAGPQYRDTARAALERAARSRARLYHHDGPWVAPRARARLVALGESDAP